MVRAAQSVENTFTHTVWWHTLGFVCTWEIAPKKNKKKLSQHTLAQLLNWHHTYRQNTNPPGALRKGSQISILHILSYIKCLRKAAVFKKGTNKNQQIDIRIVLKANASPPLHCVTVYNDILCNTGVFKFIPPVPPLQSPKNMVTHLQVSHYSISHHSEDLHQL